ncbi:MAG: peptidylprolyl isomerase [Woeseia sp.]
MNCKRLGTLLLMAAAMPAGAAAAGPTMDEVLAASTRSDWRRLDAENTLYLELPAGRVVMELATDFAPAHSANIRALARERFFDGLAIVRVQDNYVVQWGGADADRPVGKAHKSLAAEFTRPATGLEFTVLPDPDTYASQTGFAAGFPAARDKPDGTAWLAHCYGSLGAGRDTDADSGGGAELYVVIGHAPRHLDRNVTLVGRVVQGMELLSNLPRGAGVMGFYEETEQRVPIRQLRVAADLPPGERTALEVLRTDTPTFEALIESRRNRSDEWFKVPAGRIDVCNVPLPVRATRD